MWGLSRNCWVLIGKIIINFGGVSRNYWVRISNIIFKFGTFLHVETTCLQVLGTKYLVPSTLESLLLRGITPLGLWLKLLLRTAAAFRGEPL